MVSRVQQCLGGESTCVACRHASVLGRPLTNPVVDAAEHQQQKGGYEAGQHEDYQGARRHAARNLQGTAAA